MMLVSGPLECESCTQKRYYVHRRLLQHEFERNKSKLSTRKHAPNYGGKRVAHNLPQTLLLPGRANVS